MPRALITGITGQDGSYLSELLRDSGYEVIGLVREGTPAPAGIATVQGDLGDAASLRAAVLETSPDELYHLAAPTFVPASWKDPAGTLALVAGATATLLQSAPRVRGARVLVATGEISAPRASRRRRGHADRPRSPYGVAKSPPSAVDTLRQKHGLHASSAIAYNHESPRRPERFLPRKVAKAAAAIKLGLQDELVLGDMSAVRDWSHARDVVRGYQLMLQQDEPGDYVLASGSATVATRARRSVVASTPEGYWPPTRSSSPSERTRVGDISLARGGCGSRTSFEAMSRRWFRDLGALQRGGRPVAADGTPPRAPAGPTPSLPTL